MANTARLVIDPIARKISTKYEKIRLVQFDNNSERITFEMPRYVRGFDMSKCSTIEVHFDNISLDRKQKNSDIYTVTDVVIAPEDENTINFSWLVSRAATQLVGTVSFSLHFGCDEDPYEYAWHTTTYSGINVYETKHNNNEIVKTYPDVLAAWYAKFDNFAASETEKFDHFAATEADKFENFAAAEEEKFDQFSASETEKFDQFAASETEKFDALHEKFEQLKSEGVLIDLVQEMGHSKSSVMSQHATTKEFDDLREKIEAGEVHTANYMPPVGEFTSELMYGATAIITSSTSNKLSPYFEVPSGKKFTVQVPSHPDYNIGQCRTFAAFDENKNVIAGSVLENATKGTVYDIPAEAKYLRICIGQSYINNAETWGTMFIVNDDGSFVGEYVENKVEWVEGYKKLKPDVIVDGSNLSDDAMSKITAFVGEGVEIADKNMGNVSAKHIKSLRISALSQSFSSYEPTNADFIDPENYRNTNEKTAWLYGLYDSLVSDYPDYVTRTYLTETDEPSQFYDADKNPKTGYKTGIPMYRYDFKPPISEMTLSSTNMYGQKVSLPKILYISGIHGGEYGPPISGYRFFKMLCEKWREYDLLSDLRWNVHFVVIPIANPFGFEYPSLRYDENGNDVSKRNEHAIDISGNFPSDNYVENEGSEYKYGTEPLTELESIELYNIIQNENFILSVDNHSFNWIGGAANTDKKAGYFIANNAKENSINFWFKVSRWLNQHVRKCSSYIDKTFDGYDMGQVWTDKRQQMLNNTFRSVGANCEMTSGIHPTDKDSMVAETQAFRVDELAVMFYEALQDFYTY